MQKQQQNNKLKLNNSYESDPSSGSGISEHNEVWDTCNEGVTVKKYCIGTPKCSPVVGTPPKVSLMCTIYDTVVEENSCNAVDLQLPSVSKEQENVTLKQFSFDGTFRNGTLESREVIQWGRTHMVTQYKNNRSPDLFGDDGSDEEKNKELDNIDLISSEHTKRSIDCKKKLDQLSEVNLSNEFNGLIDTNLYFFYENCRRERELLRRIRKSLAGIPPPPALTVPQMDIFEAVISSKSNILNYFNADVSAQGNAFLADNTLSIFKPTHTLEQAKNASWSDIKQIRYHGLCLNLTKASENIEYLSLAVIERFIGSETASSYHNITTPSSVKKRTNRMKLLTKSPGNRLSHLAKRRAIFSSVNLAISQKALGPQILIDKGKSKHRRKATPKRKTPASKRKNRKTPSSSARKRLSFCCDLRQPHPSRETSKRALFQSPAKQTTSTIQNEYKLSIKPEIADRVEKSKRALFSPDKGANNANMEKSFSIYDNSNVSKLESLLKRKRSSIDDKEDSIELSGQNNKLFRGSFENLTPRALKIKSQSFCMGAGSTSVTAKSSELEMSATSHLTKIQRAHSDVVPTNSLTENQRKKLLWAVSQALQERKITAKHESFKQYASILARVVRRIFQEYYQKSSTSNSETMLRLAKKYVHNVMSGNNNVDDVYLQAKTYIEEAKRQCTTRLSGYIGPDEYHQLKTSQIFQQQSVCNVFPNNSTMDTHSNSLPSSTVVSFSATKNNPLLMSTNQTHVQTVERLPIQPDAALEKSSSKNNLGALALRENVDSEQRRSEQKNFTGKDQRNLSPYSNSDGSSVKTQSHLLVADTSTAKRKIKFDS